MRAFLLLLLRSVLLVGALQLPTTTIARAEETIGTCVRRMVAEADAPARRRAADVRAKETGDDLEARRALLAAFGNFPAADAGPHDVGGHVLVVPTTYDPDQPTGLLVACHGAGGQARQMVGTWQAEAERAGLLLLAPQEQGANTGYRFTEAERASTLDAIRQVRRRFNVDENRIVPTGIRCGGHLRARPGVGARSRLPSWSHLRPLLNRELLEVAVHSSGFAQSSRSNLT